MEKDAAEACGLRHSRAKARRGYRWAHTRGKVGFHAGKIEVDRPRVRGFAGRDLLVVQFDGIHITEHLVLVAAIGIDAQGIKHPLALAEGATENAAVVQALIDDLIERGLDPAVPRLFIIDGSKALSRAIRRSFG